MTLVFRVAAVALIAWPVTARAQSAAPDPAPPPAVAPTGSYWDWSLGADVAYRNLTFNVSDTDIADRDAAYLRPSFSKGQDSTGNIADGTLVVSPSAAF